MMLLNLIAKVLLTGLSISSTLLLFSEFTLAQTQPTASVTTKFRCIALDKGYATIAQRGHRITGPMITWNSTAFGTDYTPEHRCELVSQRLTEAVANNGGKLSNLRLTYGPVNSYPVICYINNLDEYCNSNNLLLTLNRSDLGKEDQILQQLVQFGKWGKGAPVTRGTRVILQLGIQIENALDTANTSVVSPLPVASPATVPSTSTSTDNSL